MDGIHPLSSYPEDQTKTRDTSIQILLSVSLGLGAFIAFCVRRLASLNNALLTMYWCSCCDRDGTGCMRLAKGKKTEEMHCQTFLILSLAGCCRYGGSQINRCLHLRAWMHMWYVVHTKTRRQRLTPRQFLQFFRMAIKFLTVTLFFSLVVIKPVHDSFPDDDDIPSNSTKKPHHHQSFHNGLKRSINLQSVHAMAPWVPEELETDYLWMYLVFAYLFTSFALYLIVSETRKIIEIRQEYLGSQTTITDRTIRLSGIPPDMQSEGKIKDFMEDLDIGKVESVTLCRKWKELDDAMVARNNILRKLEEAWTVHLGFRRIERTLETLPTVQPSPPGPAIDPERDDDAEQSRLLGANGPMAPYGRERPKINLRFGRFKLQSRTVDAIDYYEEKLRKLDDKIRELRQREFEPTPLAFVTMDSVASCQMAVQAVLDPSPLQLIASVSPAPTDVVWTNTYLSRRTRMFRAWSITALIVVLTIFWSVILAPVAGALNLGTIRKVLPQLAEFLEARPTASSLVTTQLPTLTISLFNVLVPYFYDWLANCQGMTSQGDVELSVISKNFFFTFFNFFVVFTVLGTASNLYNFFQDFGDSLKDTTKIAYTLALSLQRLLSFYVNFIILQGVGLFPFRLLEFGSVFMYPITLIGAKTPRGKLCRHS